MNVRQLAFLSFVSLTFDGCGGGGGGSQPLVNSTGGSCSKLLSAVGTGGIGGNFTAHAEGDITFRSNLFPSFPALPTASTTGTELTNAMITAGTPIAGNILVSSTLQISAGVNPATITTNTGDVVINATLIGERSAGSATNAISISAPAGTIYIRGAIQTRGTAGTPDNPDGGNITLTAQRIVMTGSIDASGESKPGGTGGNGGVVVLDTTGAGGNDLSCTGPSLRTSGGMGAQGGNGGNVTLKAAGKLALFSPVLAGGGAASSLVAVTPTGGNGGSITLRGDGGGDVTGTISAEGGDSSGYADGAKGGAGGALTADSAAAWRIFGALVTRGGSAFVQAVGSGILGAGNAGNVSIGGVTRATSLSVGSGILLTSGGSGSAGGGNAGSFDIDSLDGNIYVGSSLICHGGNALMWSASAGAGGAVTIKTDASVSGNTSNHTLTIAGDILDAGGGVGLEGFFPRGGGDGGPVTLQCGGDLAFSGRLIASGGSGRPGGHAGVITLQIWAANLAATGRMDVTGTLLAEGGNSNPGQPGGNGNFITLTAVGGAAVSGTLSTKGGLVGGVGSGEGRTVSISSVLGNIDLFGSVTTSASQNVGWPASGDLTVSTAGSITIGATIDVSGAPPDPAQNNDASGAPSGSVSVTASGAGGSITLLEGTDIKANGGAAGGGGTNPPGGAGGKVTLKTVDQAVAIAGTISARGGFSPNSAGGPGGQLVVNSDSDGNGTGGAITIARHAEINVSGGGGFTGGSALNNGGTPPADSSGANLAVVLDAGGNLTSSPNGGNEGIVQNLGIIIARGGSPVARGGDIWFDGKNVSGLNLGSADGGTMTLTGSLGNGGFFPN